MEKDEADVIVEKIKKIEIQGARNVAKAALKALKIKEEKGLSKEELIKFAFELMNVRPTEPMTKHLVESIIISSLLKNLPPKEEIDKTLNRIQEEFTNLIEIGANLIPDNSTILTYCHSSTVTNIIKRANEFGKEIKVIVGETRPLYQGRITAKELSSYGINTTLVVDGALSTFIKKADLVMVGADAVTAEGDLINKVGTSMVAKIAYYHHIPFYSAFELYKYDKYSVLGLKTPIEERDKKEVWENHPQNINIKNPAFDLTESNLIKAYITQEGIITPQSLPLIATKYLNKLL